MKPSILVFLVIVSCIFVGNARLYRETSPQLRSAAKTNDYYNDYQENYMNDLYELNYLRNLRRKREVCLSFLNKTN